MTDILHKHNISTELTECCICRTKRNNPIATGKDYLHECSLQEFTVVECSNCGHIYLNPRPKIEDIYKIYPEEYATYERHFGREGSILTKIKDIVLMTRFKRVVKYLPELPSILDIGCGDGAFLLALRRHYPKASLSGLDFKFGDGVKKDLEDAGIEVIEGTLEDASLRSEAYDLITANQIIEHVWNVSLVLKTCNRALTVGGILSLETPNPDGWDRNFFRRRCWGSYYMPRHLNLFSKKHLETVLNHESFDVKETKSLLAPPCWIYSCQFFLHEKGMPRMSRVLFSDTNIFWLAFFACLDTVARLFQLETSNQKIIAEKRQT